MIKKKILLILGILFLFSIPSMILNNNSSNSINQLKPSENTITNYRSQPKSSGYAINAVWNSTKTGNVKGLAISSIGNYIVVGHNENISLFNNYASTFKKPIWTINTTYNIVDVDISGDGTYIAAIYAGNLSLFDNSPSSFKKPIWTFNTSHSVTDVAISLDGNYIALGSCSTSGYVWLFNTTNFKGKEMWKASTCQTSKTLIDISHNGEYIAVASNWFSTGAANFYLFNKSYPQYNIPMWSNMRTDMSFNSLAISNDGVFVVAATYKTLYGSDLILMNKTFAIGTTKKELWKYFSANSINDVAISYYGDLITAGDDFGFVYLFNNTSSSNVQPIWAHQQYTDLDVSSVSISGDGQYIVAGFETVSAITGMHFIVLFNATKTTPKYFEWGDVIQSNTPIYNVEISLDGRFFVSNKVVSSTFNITLYHHNIPIPSIIFSLIGDDDDSNGNVEEPIQIPFGNYYLIFAVIALISLIVLMKRKII